MEPEHGIVGVMPDTVLGGGDLGPSCGPRQARVPSAEHPALRVQSARGCGVGDTDGQGPVVTVSPITSAPGPITDDEAGQWAIGEQLADVFRRKLVRSVLEDDHQIGHVAFELLQGIGDGLERRGKGTGGESQSAVRSSANWTQRNRRMSRTEMTPMGRSLSSTTGRWR